MSLESVRAGLMNSSAEPRTLVCLCLASSLLSTLWELQISGICSDTHRKSLPQRMEGKGLTLRALLSSEFTGEPRVGDAAVASQSGRSRIPSGAAAVLWSMKLAFSVTVELWLC